MLEFLVLSIQLFVGATGHAGEIAERITAYVERPASPVVF
jgi:hypothetical protein